MHNLKLEPLDLTLFDGSEGASAAGGESGSMGETSASPAPTRQGKKAGEYQNVLFGKQESTESAPDAGENEKTEVITTSDTLEERKKAFRDLINGEYKDLYTEETQRIINRRFSETKALQETVLKSQPLIDMLMQRYNVKDGDIEKLTSAIENDDAYWNEAAEEAGLSVQQYKELQKLKRENEYLLRLQREARNKAMVENQLNKWVGESEAVKAKYPEFQLESEVNNPQFLSLLKSGVPVLHAYEVLHMDDIKSGVMEAAARQTEKKVVDGIRAKGARPTENGISSQSAFTIKDDPSKWSKKDRAEVVRRALQGETIRL